MKKIDYTSPVTEFVALNPIYEIMDLNLTGSKYGSGGPGEEGIFVNKDEHGGSWEGIWEAE
ncbi:MAG: hypothetical protein IKL54_04900 [Bacteroidaceae bacterium]|nr:hypothetical protein [Bacteroidaceae bacterium]